MCEYIRVCKKCKTEVVFDKDLVTSGENNYDCVCLNCDEDLWLHETIQIKNDEVERFISDEDKEYYKEKGFIPYDYDDSNWRW